MIGRGRPGDPLWFAIGFAVATVAGICFHQIGAGLAMGLALGVMLAVAREDLRRGYRRPADPLWFLIGLGAGASGSVWLHHRGLPWSRSLGIGLALGCVFGAVAGTIRAERRLEQDRENRDLARRYRD